YDILKHARIPSFTFIFHTYVKGAYARITQKGSTTLSCVNFSDMLVNLRNKIKSTPGSAYFYVYWHTIDQMAHSYGPHSEQYAAELQNISRLLQQEFVQKMDSSKAHDVLLFFTADHGHISIHPQETIYLNAYPEIESYFRLSTKDRRILPWGSARDVFLAIQEGKLEQAIRALRDALGDAAMILTTEAAVKRGLFGKGRAHAQFQKRIGDILVLPKNSRTIWYEHTLGKKVWFLGTHGGLSPDEMLVPFLATRLSDIQ
ncbi:MAG TPA: alkaline phosphatase family protein, partial [Patescibacteria group bacterium]|nr:alkaline phosphatase family protein [Patescibacteria group bacterium]